MQPIQQPENEQHFFSISEVEDILRSKKNMIYMLHLNSHINRLLLTPWKDVYTGFSQGRLERQ